MENTERPVKRRKLEQDKEDETASKSSPAVVLNKLTPDQNVLKRFKRIKDLAKEKLNKNVEKKDINKNTTQGQEENSAKLTRVSTVKGDESKAETELNSVTVEVLDSSDNWLASDERGASKRKRDVNSNENREVGKLAKIRDDNHATSSKAGMSSNLGTLEDKVKDKEQSDASTSCNSRASGSVVEVAKVAQDYAKSGAQTEKIKEDEPTAKCKKGVPTNKSGAQTIKIKEDEPTAKLDEVDDKVDEEDMGEYGEEADIYVMLQKVIESQSNKYANSVKEENAKLEKRVDFLEKENQLLQKTSKRLHLALQAVMKNRQKEKRPGNSCGVQVNLNFPSNEKTLSKSGGEPVFSKKPEMVTIGVQAFEHAQPKVIREGMGHFKLFSYQKNRAELSEPSGEKGHFKITARGLEPRKTFNEMLEGSRSVVKVTQKSPSCPIHGQENTKSNSERSDMAVAQKPESNERVTLPPQTDLSKTGKNTGVVSPEVIVLSPNDYLSPTFPSSQNPGRQGSSFPLLQDGNVDTRSQNTERDALERQKDSQTVRQNESQPCEPMPVPTQASYIADRRVSERESQRNFGNYTTDNASRRAKIHPQDNSAHANLQRKSINTMERNRSLSEESITNNSSPNPISVGYSRSPTNSEKQISENTPRTFSNISQSRPTLQERVPMAINTATPNIQVFRRNSPSHVVPNSTNIRVPNVQAVQQSHFSQSTAHHQNLQNRSSQLLTRMDVSPHVTYRPPVVRPSEAVRLSAQFTHQRPSIPLGLMQQQAQAHEHRQPSPFSVSAAPYRHPIASIPELQRAQNQVTRLDTSSAIQLSQEQQQILLRQQQAQQRAEPPPYHQNVGQGHAQRRARATSPNILRRASQSSDQARNAQPRQMAVPSRNQSNVPLSSEYERTSVQAVPSKQRAYTLQGNVQQTRQGPVVVYQPGALEGAPFGQTNQEQTRQVQAPQHINRDLLRTQNPMQQRPPSSEDVRFRRNSNPHEMQGHRQESNPSTSNVQTISSGSNKTPPQPSASIAIVENGIVLSWNVSGDQDTSGVDSYELFACQDDSNANAPPILWKKIGVVKALPLPMACTLTQFSTGSRYQFAVRAVDAAERAGPFSDPCVITLKKP